ncbi:hypothetical protein Mapa_007874 [Marchantia paleacea]|nr:hypothetical protein Mapa_007874 [Marchantia paleacea]
MALTKGSNLRRDSVRLLVSMFFFCSVELMQIRKANAALSPEEESALESWRQRFNLTKWTVDPCVDSITTEWLTCSTAGQTSTVVSIDLKQRNLTGTIPDTTAFTNLSRLVLSENNLTGGLPASIFNQSTLQLLYLESNQFGGPIPDMSALTSLTDLALDSTQINGTIPESINHMTAATHIRVQRNPKLTGDLPDLSALTNLLYLDAEFCALNGSLPDLRNAKDLISVLALESLPNY